MKVHSILPLKGNSACREKWHVTPADLCHRKLIISHSSHQQEDAAQLGTVYNFCQYSKITVFSFWYLGYVRNTCT